MFILICLVTSLKSFSQSYPAIDWNRDTVSATVATGGQGKFINDMGASGKKSTTYVTFDVAKLKTIMDNCAANGVANVQFMIVYIRAEDTARYASLHPGMTTNEKKDIIGRQSLILKVPSTAFFNTTQKSGAMIPKDNPLMIALLAAGLVPLDQPYGNLPFAGSVYFGTGTICPPPASCN